MMLVTIEPEKIYIVSSIHSEVFQLNSANINEYSIKNYNPSLDIINLSALNITNMNQLTLGNIHSSKKVTDQKHSTSPSTLIIFHSIRNYASKLHLMIEKVSVEQLSAFNFIFADKEQCKH